jgi:putative endonuclease
MANRRNGTLYVGVTNSLARRVYEHREGLLPGFTRTYGLKTLVYYEPYDSIASAIHREKRLKKYPRQWKINLIEARNPHWLDLYNQLNQ